MKGRARAQAISVNVEAGFWPTYRPAADVPAVITATIDDVLCAEPAEKWCKYVKKTNGLYDIEASPGEIDVQTTIPNTTTGKKLAAEMCASLGLYHFDENGTRLDYNHIHILQGDIELARCNPEDS
jgi:hypothetical protein